MDRIDLQAKTAKKEIVLSLSTSDDSIVMLDKSQGQILVKISHDMTAEASWSQAYYDMQLIHNDGKVLTVLKGEVQMTKDITRVTNG